MCLTLLGFLPGASSFFAIGAVPLAIDIPRGGSIRPHPCLLAHLQEGKPPFRCHVLRSLTCSLLNRSKLKRSASPQNPVYQLRPTLTFTRPQRFGPNGYMYTGNGEYQPIGQPPSGTSSSAAQSVEQILMTRISSAGPPRYPYGTVS